MINKDQSKILLSVVTRNRPSCLNTFLNLAEEQTLQPDAILIVDNDSDEETKKLVSERMVKNKKIHYVNTYANLGSGGGQSIALTYATSKGFDLVYTFDDDCEPDSFALQHIFTRWINHPEKENLVLSSIALRPNQNELFSFGVWEINSHVFGKSNKIFWDYESLDKRYLQDNFFPNWANFFLGTLIPTSVIRRAGVVNPKYFIRGDELEFFVRLKTLNVNMGIVLNSIVHHPYEDNKQTSVVKKYYTVRNNTEIRLKYYSTFRHNKFFFKLWLIKNKLFKKHDTLDYIAIRDALKNNFTRMPSDVAELFSNKR